MIVCSPDWFAIKRSSNRIGKLRHGLIAAAICTSLCLAGCGGANIRLVPVSGTVSMDEKPLANKTVRFQPEPGTPGHGGGATTDAQGNYTAIALVPGSTKDFKGLAPGNYRVTVVERMFPEGLAVQGKSAEPEVAVGPVASPSVKELPTIYSRPESTPLSITISEQGGKVDIRLESNSN